jgi:hypothetical protein
MIRAPPCSRDSAQLTASSSSRHIAPTPRAAMPIRSSVNHARCSASPSPTPPTTASSSTTTSVKRIVGCPCGYECVNGGSSTTSMPAHDRSTRNSVGPASVCATTMYTAATSP